MSEGDANSWKEEFFDSAEQISAQTGMTLTLGTYKNFIAEIEKDFSPYGPQPRHKLENWTIFLEETVKTMVL